VQVVPSLSKATRRKQRRGFGAFRVPKNAKRFVQTTLENAEKEESVRVREGKSNV